MRIDRIARNVEWTNNFKIASFWSQILVLQIEIFFKYVNFPICSKIPKISYSENSKNVNLGKFQHFNLGKCYEFLIWKIPRISKLGNSNNLI